MSAWLVPGSGDAAGMAPLPLPCRCFSVFSDLRITGQIGATTPGFAVDTLVALRSRTALLGRWFWWPLCARARQSDVSKMFASRRLLAPVAAGPP